MMRQGTNYTRLENLACQALRVQTEDRKHTAQQGKGRSALNTPVYRTKAIQFLDTIQYVKLIVKSIIFERLRRIPKRTKAVELKRRIFFSDRPGDALGSFWLTYCSMKRAQLSRQIRHNAK